METAAHRVALLLDLDDTLYDYAPAERAAKQATLAAVTRDIGLDGARLEVAWDRAREAVKGRLGERGSAHSRLLYLAELVHATGVAGSSRGLARVRSWERTYWGEFLRVAKLRPGALPLLDGWRARGGKVAIVTDLTLEIQLWKLEAFDLFDRVDVLVVSEEVALDKPAPEAMLLAMARLGVTPDQCVVVGDHPVKDGGGARALGIPYYQAVSSEHAREGASTLEAIAEKLGVTR